MNKENQALGILISNLGTPDAPTPQAVRKYLNQFLSDPRIDTGLPMWLWLLILNGVILPLRSRKSARLYQKVWTTAGSPLLLISQQQQQELQQHINQILPQQQIKVVLGMRYGNPSIASALAQLQAAQVKRIIVLPLYPQYASASSASVFDAVSAYFKTQRHIPELQFISDYHQNSLYIQALAQSVREYWQQNGKPTKLLMSFHGIQQRVATDGDPYPQHCETTARLLAQALGLNDEEWQLVYQSRFGREAWLKPYADQSLKALGEQKIRRVDVICPGFSADCLETLEEINHENREIFLQAGGEAFHYIPALNTQQNHIHALTQILIDAI